MSDCAPAGLSPPRRRGGPAQTPVRITRISSLTRALIGMSSPLAARPTRHPGAPARSATNTTSTSPAQLHSRGKTEVASRLLLKGADRVVGRASPLLTNSKSYFNHVPAKWPPDWARSLSPPEYRVIPMSTIEMRIKERVTQCLKIVCVSFCVSISACN